jgi:uncharacterized protein YoxC
MNDHVARMVHTWFAKLQSDPRAVADPEESLADLVSAVHRMVREAENEIRRRCEELAVEVAGSEVGGSVALAIRTDSQESLPRKSLIEIYAPELRRKQ